MCIFIHICIHTHITEKIIRIKMTNLKTLEQEAVLYMFSLKFRVGGTNWNLLERSYMSILCKFLHTTLSCHVHFDQYKEIVLVIIRKVISYFTWLMCIIENLIHMTYIYWSCCCCCCFVKQLKLFIWGCRDCIPGDSQMKLKVCSKLQAGSAGL